MHTVLLRKIALVCAQADLFSGKPVSKKWGTIQVDVQGSLGRRLQRIMGSKGGFQKRPLFLELFMGRLSSRPDQAGRSL